MEEELMDAVESWEDKDGRPKTTQLMCEIGKHISKIGYLTEELVEAAREEGRRGV